MNQNDIELCKTTGFWWVDRPEPLKNQSWQWSLDQTGEILRCKSYESNNTENIGFDQKKRNQSQQKKQTRKPKPRKKNKKNNKKNCGKCRFLFCFFLVFFVFSGDFSCRFVFLVFLFLFLFFFVFFIFWLKSTFSVLHGVIMQESGKNWIEISEQERRCFGLCIFFGIGSV